MSSFKRSLSCLALLLGLTITVSAMSNKVLGWTTDNGCDILLLNLGKGSLSFSADGYVLKSSGKVILSGYVSTRNFEDIL